MLPAMLRRPELARGASGWSDPFDILERELSRGLQRGGNGEEPMIAAYPVDIREDDRHLYVEAELPGFRKDEVGVTLENGILTISGEHEPEQEKQQQGQNHLSERRYNRVQRSFTLPTPVDENNVDAKLEEGVLKITLNKREEVKPRKIEVK
jgi:HSP20 family protein